MIGRGNGYHHRLKVKYNPEPTHVFLYEDHCYVLNALRYARTQGVLHRPVNLLYFVSVKRTPPRCHENPFEG